MHQAGSPGQPGRNEYGYARERGREYHVPTVTRCRVKGNQQFAVCSSHAHPGSLAGHGAGAPLPARRRGSEDTEAVIERRLRVYLDKTVPLLEYHADREWLFTVDGAQPPDAVHADIVAGLQKLADFAAWTRQGVSRR